MDKRYCFNCDEQISEETLAQYPDTEICGECIDDDICYQAIQTQTNERREGSFEDLSNLDKRVWRVIPCIWKEPSPLCEIVVAKMYRPDEDLDGFYYTAKEIFSINDLVGLYL